MSTQLKQQVEEEEDGGLDPQNADPRPRRRRIAYRLKFWLKFRRSEYSLTFALVIGRLRARERQRELQRQPLRMVGQELAEPMMLKAEPPVLEEADSGDSRSGVSFSATLATETMTSSQEYPVPVLGVTAGPTSGPG